MAKRAPLASTTNDGIVSPDVGAALRFWRSVLKNCRKMSDFSNNENNEVL
jgi:hypothetical protein